MDIKGEIEPQQPQNVQSKAQPVILRRVIMLFSLLSLATFWWKAPFSYLELFSDWMLEDKNIAPRAVSKPNFILIMTDDQDLHMNSIQYQPSVQKEFAEQGTFFNKHYCTIAICCPSRVSFLTGKAAHKYVSIELELTNERG